MGIICNQFYLRTGEQIQAFDFELFAPKIETVLFKTSGIIWDLQQDQGTTVPEIFTENLALEECVKICN